MQINALVTGDTALQLQMHYVWNATFFSSWAGRVGTLFCAFQFSAMGDTGYTGRCNSPPAISWQSYSSGALLQTVQEITKVLQQFLEVPASSWDTATDSRAAASAPGPAPGTAPGLTRPWTCGFACRWCDQACTRKEGHNNHSCYEHRHRR